MSSSRRRTPCPRSPYGLSRSPAARGGIGFDDLRYSPSLKRVLVPAGRTGTLVLIDPATQAMDTIAGFSSSAQYGGGHGEGITSVDEGVGLLYVTDRSAKQLQVIDPASKKVLTDGIAALSKGALRAEADRRKLAEAMRAFNRMYRAHAAREDTVLFPAFHDLLGEKAYMELGEEFEDKERTVLGDKGFERAVADVAGLETQMGIADIDKFTPA